MQSGPRLGIGADSATTRVCCRARCSNGLETLALSGGEPVTAAVAEDVSADWSSASLSRPTPIVGRVDELTELHDLMSQARLVTVTGVGGVGKTRLVAELLGEQSGRSGRARGRVGTGRRRHGGDVVGLCAGRTRRAHRRADDRRAAARRDAVAGARQRRARARRGARGRASRARLVSGGANRDDQSCPPRAARRGRAAAGTTPDRRRSVRCRATLRRSGVPRPLPVRPRCR